MELNKVKGNKYTVVLDPGHGGRDPGAVANGLQEKKLNLALALKTAERLSGLQVILTRESDVFVSLADRIAMSNRAGAHLFVSLHANAGGGHGFESFIYQGLGSADPTVKIQGAIHRSTMKVLSRWNIRDRGLKRSKFYVLRQTRAPAVLLESLFIDNLREAELWKDSHFIEALADGVAEGIITSLDLKVGVEEEAELYDKSEEANNHDNSKISQEEGGSSQILYTVQVGAFSRIENARDCAEQARSAGFADAFIYTKKVI